jgi:hypothetical protein
MKKNDRSDGLLFAAVFALACVIASLPSEAQIGGPCADEAAKYCGNLTPGGGRIMQCLDNRRYDLSLACRDWVEDQTKSLKELNTVCAGEIVRFCTRDSPDSISIYLCLHNNYAALEIDCREKVREIGLRFQ